MRISVDDFDLSVDPRMLKFGESVFNIMLIAHHIKSGAFFASSVAQAVHR
ncbi:hypothetical protein [Holospora obtusa]|nr:hypothetical protein [Holospora obtusa]